MDVVSVGILWRRYTRHAMASPITSPRPRGLALTLGWRRLLVAFVASTLLGLLLSPAFPSLSTARVIGREWVVGLAALVAFGLFEQWPARLPQWLARWVLQILCVAIAIPLAVLVLYLLPHDDPRPFWQVEARMHGFSLMTLTGLLVAPWIAVAALFRQLDFAARSQALAFDLERSELVITGRTKHFLSLTGEHLGVENMNKAIELVSDEFNVSIPEYTVVGFPYQNFFAHRWYVATNDKVDPEQLRKRIDENLRMLNDDYATERDSALKEVFLEILPEETFMKFMELKGKLGSQHKFPRVMKGKMLEEWERFLLNGTL
jgi:hypothetical protein